MTRIGYVSPVGVKRDPLSEERFDFEAITTSVSSGVKTRLPDVELLTVRDLLDGDLVLLC